MQNQYVKDCSDSYSTVVTCLYAVGGARIIKPTYIYTQKEGRKNRPSSFLFNYIFYHQRVFATSYSHTSDKRPSRSEQCHRVGNGQWKCVKDTPE